MLREMPWPVFQEWIAFDTIHPIGERRGDWQAATICASIWNSAFASHGSRKRVKPGDFLLEFTDDPKPAKDVDDEKKPSTPWQHMKMIARMQVALANAEEKKKEPRRGRRR